MHSTSTMVPFQMMVLLRHVDWVCRCFTALEPCGPPISLGPFPSCHGKPFVLRPLWRDGIHLEGCLGGTQPPWPQLFLSRLGRFGVVLGAGASVRCPCCSILLFCWYVFWFRIALFYIDVVVIIF